LGTSNGISDPDSPISELSAKIDSLKRFPIKTSIIFAIGLSSFFAYYDITNYSYISPVLKTQWNVTDSDIAGGATMTIFGYVIGAIVITAVSDSKGRKTAFILSVIVLGVGSFLTSTAQNMTEMQIFRLLTGIGIGSEIVMASVYMGEISPRLKRGKYTSLIIVIGWAGLTASGPVSLVLIQQNELLGVDGWRIVMGLSGLPALVSLLFRVRMPESPRWLVSKGKIKEVNSVLSSLGLSPLKAREFHPSREGRGITKLFLDRKITLRIAFLTGVWFLTLVPIYASLLLVVEYVNQGFSLSESISINILSSVGFIAGGILSIQLAEKFERKYQIAVSGVIMGFGFILRGFLINDYIGLVIAGFITFAANAWLVSSLLTYTAENFPTKIRSSASGVTEGISRIIGAIGPFVFVFLQPFGFLNVMMGIALFSFVAAGIVLLGINTRGKPLEKLSNEQP
jgi:MFS transporter, putative metabolite:H+ symporter